MKATVAGIAHRPTDGEPLVEIEACTLVPGRGLDTENRKPGKREVTFLSAKSWADACHELGTDLPWYTRRANILVDHIDLAGAIGKTLGIGPVRVLLHGETKPCQLMDQQHAGLRQALVPEFRGGAFGQVLVGGTVRVGDEIIVFDGASAGR